MDFAPGLRLVRTYWVAVLSITLLACAAGYGASYLVDETYTASTRILVRAREARLLTSSGQDLSRTPGAIDSQMSKPLAQTYSGLVQSRIVAEQVVKDLELDTPRPKDESLLGQLRSTFKQWYYVAIAFAKYGFYAEPTPFEAAVGNVQRNVEAKPIKDSFLIEIAAKADDPQLAAALATSATGIFMRENHERFREGAATYSSFLQQEMENFRLRAVEAQQAVRRYKEEKGIADVAEQLRLSSSSLESAQSELRSTDAALEQARARYDSLQEAINRTPSTVSSTETVRGQSSGESPLTTSSVTVAEIGASTVTTEVPPSTAVIETGRSSTTTTNPGSTSTTHNGGQTTTTRNDTTTTQRSNTTTTEERTSVMPNRVYQDLAVTAAQVRAEIAGLEARRESLAAAVQQAAVSGLPEAEAQLGEMQLVASTAAEAYKRIGTMYESALLNDAWGTEEVSLVDPAAVPLYPDGPKRYLFAVIGLLFGIIGGIGTTYIIDGMRKAGMLKGRLLPEFRRPLPETYASTQTGSYASTHMGGSPALDTTLQTRMGPGPSYDTAMQMRTGPQGPSFDSHLEAYR